MARIAVSMVTWAHGTRTDALALGAIEKGTEEVPPRVDVVVRNDPLVDPRRLRGARDVQDGVQAAAAVVLRVPAAAAAAVLCCGTSALRERARGVQHLMVQAGVAADARLRQLVPVGVHARHGVVRRDVGAHGLEVPGAGVCRQARGRERRRLLGQALHLALAVARDALAHHGAAQRARLLLALRRAGENVHVLAVVRLQGEQLLAQVQGESRLRGDARHRA